MDIVSYATKIAILMNEARAGQPARSLAEQCCDNGKTKDAQGKAKDGKCKTSTPKSLASKTSAATWHWATIARTVDYDSRTSEQIRGEGQGHRRRVGGSDFLDRGCGRAI